MSVPDVVLARFRIAEPTATQIANGAIESLRYFISESAGNDLLNAVLVDIRNLLTFETQRAFVDPSPTGQLGPLWPSGVPEWWRPCQNEFEELIASFRKDVQSRIEHSTKRCSPEDLAEEYKAHFNSIGYERSPNPCPFIEQMIIASYESSMQQEEGRPVRFQLQFQSSNLSVHVPFQCAYSATNLVKLAPIVGIGFRHIIVRPDASEKNIQIVGISDLELSNEGERDTNNWSLLRNTYHDVKSVDFRLRVLGPGHIQIAENNTVWELRNGSIHYFQPITTVTAIQSWLRTAFQGSSRSSIAVPQLALCRIIQKMVDAKHGGAVVIVEQATTNLANKYSPNTDILREVIEETIRAEDVIVDQKVPMTIKDGERVHNSSLKFARVLDSIAALTTVDGATVLDRNMNVLGFGTEITNTNNSSDDVIECLALVLGVGHGTIVVGKKKASDFGMRHRSAYGFCKENPSAIAIVVSQDGGIRLFCTENKKVVLYQNVIPDQYCWGWMKREGPPDNTPKSLLTK